MRISIRRGRTIALPGAPEQTIVDRRPTACVGLLGSDYPTIRPAFAVEVGTRVSRGQVLFTDRHRPQIALTAPASGTVAAITRGARRRLDSVVIRIEGDDAERFAVPPRLSRAALTDLLLRSGLWPALRTRPFERIPNPGTVPAAIFVTALDTAPLAADPRVVIGAQQEQFARGIAALELLTDGQVFVCQAPGPPLATERGRVRVAEFVGPHPAGLAGTHIHMLRPASATRTVWHIGYQDVIAVGHLLANGQLPSERVVALTGPGVSSPRLVSTRPGADLEELLEGEVCERPTKVLSGSLLGGRSTRFLGRYHQQVTVLRVAERPNGLAAALARLMRVSGDAIVPMPVYDQVMPLAILPVPLLRALSIGDVETAERLGVLELAEEDLALLSHICPAGGDYGPLLRQVLDELEQAA